MQAKSPPGNSAVGPDPVHQAVHAPANDWKPFGPEITIRENLENLARELALQQMAKNNLDRQMHLLRREVTESVSLLQVEMNSQLMVHQGQNRTELQNLHDSMTDRIHNNDLRISQDLKLLKTQGLQRDLRINQLEQNCAARHENHLQNLRSVNTRIQLLTQQFSKKSPTGTGDPEINPCADTTTDQIPADCTINQTDCGFASFIPPPTAVIGDNRKACPNCHKMLSKRYLPTHLARKVCQKH